ncbi:hypothetical protein KI387_031430 [Taxus chinensis]|uniref:Uncharacterized protein n=1 Tax=Taxus chinensis TaxID=29808 RepID=A0AA38CNJ2_TAXCH|nr:hypothetical protein KI387_031430 [Taxus chinensis]
MSATGQLGVRGLSDPQSHLSPNKGLLSRSNFYFGSCIVLRKTLSLSKTNRFWSHSGCEMSRKHNAVVVSAEIKSLATLPLYGIINTQGRIQPIEDPETVASVFAVFDRNKKIQYIGFSKDLKNSLRTLMGRRPELCYYYRTQNLTSFDQELMISIRQKWIDEVGSTPPGNSSPSDRAQWEQPALANSISERGRAAAAVSKAKTMQQMMHDRGIKEEMIYDPVLLEQGKLNILPTKRLSPEELAQNALAQAAAEATRKKVSVPIPSGGVLEYDIFYEMKFKTNGGWMYDVAVTYDDKETKHRIIVGQLFPDAVEMVEDNFLERVIGFLLHKQIPRHTEGMLRSSEFNINYFAIGEVYLRFRELQEWFSKELPPHEWRFAKLEMYGAHIDPPPPVGPFELSR